MEIQTIINGKKETVTVREFVGMYQILTGTYAMGVIRKDEVIGLIDRNGNLIKIGDIVNPSNEDALYVSFKVGGYTINKNNELCFIKNTVINQYIGVSLPVFNYKKFL